MYRYSSTLRSWLLAALCSATALTFSCERKADNPQPTTQQSSGEVTSAQEIATAQKVFEASSYTSALKEVDPNGKLIHQWQPQWKTAFRVGGALYVPLSFAEKVSNAKHFLVVQNDVYSLALYIFPTGQSIELVKDSPDFLRTFTGKLGLRRLDTKKSRLLVFDNGRVQARAQGVTPGAKPSAGATTLGCVTNTTCYWDGRCYGPHGGNVVFLEITQGTNGTCEQPEVRDCGWGWNTVWEMYRSQSEQTCESDPDPTPGGGGGGGGGGEANPRMTDGWYRINVVSSGLVLDVSGGNTNNGANVTEWSSHGSSNQIWYVAYYGWDNLTGQEVYTFTPRSNFLYWQSLGTPPGPSLEQVLTVLPSGAPSTDVAAPAQIWAISTCPIPPSSPTPYRWLLSYAGLTNYTSQAKNKYTFSNQYSGLYLNVSGSGANYGQLIQWLSVGGRSNSNLNEQFTFTRLPL